MKTLDLDLAPRDAAAPLARPGAAAAVLAALLAAGPAAAGYTSHNAVVIDFDQAGLILGWVGLWLVGALTFAACADKRIRMMTRLAEYLQRRSARRATARTEAALRAWARHDPRIEAELRAARDRAEAQQPLSAPAEPAPAIVAAAAPALSPVAAAAATTVRRPQPRGLRIAPLPGLPRHLQYLPG